MKVYNNRIERDLGLTSAVAGLSGAPTTKSTYGGITQEQYLDDTTELSYRAAASLISELDRAHGQRYHERYSIPEIFRALSATNRAILYSGRFTHALAEAAIRESIPNEYMHLAYTAIKEHGVAIPSTHPLPMLWIFTDKVIKVPDVEQYTSKDSTRDKLLIPLNFEITDLSKIRAFSANGGDWA